MRKFTILLTVLFTLFTVTGINAETSVSMKISGPGAVNDSTIKAGEKVSFDIYTTNDTIRIGFTLGFAIKSPDIKKVIHAADSGNGLNPPGDIKGYNGWNDNSIWDFQGVYVVDKDWDGALPELLGFGGISVKQGYKKEVEPSKKLSFDLIIPETGTLVVDSSYYPPAGEWYYSSPQDIERLHKPSWGGPYTFKVIK